MPRDNRGFSLVGFEPDADCEHLFSRMLEEARRGVLVGAIVVPLYKRIHVRQGETERQYAVSLCGWASNNHTLSAGILNCCTRLVEESALRDAGLV